MKTSVIEVHAMLSVLSVDEVEKRIGEVPGVNSVTVNFAAENATVRYDETRLEVADIKSALRLRAHGPAMPAEHDGPDGHASHTAPAGLATEHAPVAPLAPVATKEPDAHDMHAGVKMPDTSAAAAPQPDTTPKPDEPDTPSLLQRLQLWLSPSVAPADPKAAAPPAAADGHTGHAGHSGHAGDGGSPSPMSSDMAAEMGHGGNMDLPAMVRDMRNRFWICFVFTVPIFIYSPMGNMFPAPAPPFGLPLNQWLFSLASAAEGRRGGREQVAHRRVDEDGHGEHEANPEAVAHVAHHGGQVHVAAVAHLCGHV